MLETKEIYSKRIGWVYKIPKVSVIDYLMRDDVDGKWKTKWKCTKVKAITGKKKIAVSVAETIKVAFENEIKQELAPKSPLEEQLNMNFVEFLRMRFHDLRHTMETELSTNRVDLKAIGEWLGHGDLESTKIYSHPHYRKKLLVMGVFTKMMQDAREKEQKQLTEQLQNCPTQG